MKLTEHQQDRLNQCLQLLKEGNRVLIFGSAGTGKTTLCKRVLEYELCDDINRSEKFPLNEFNPNIDYNYDTEKYLSEIENYALINAKKIFLSETDYDKKKYEVVCFPENNNYELRLPKNNFERGETVIAKNKDTFIIGIYQGCSDYIHKPYKVSDLIYEDILKFESMEQYKNLCNNQ